MIFYFDEKIEDLDSRSIAKTQDLFDQLIRISRLGEHYVIISRNCSRWALRNLTFSEKNHAHLNALSQSASTRSGILDVCHFYCAIRFGASGVQVESDKIYVLGVEDFLEGFYCDRTTVVVENSTYDGRMFDIIIRHHARRKGHPVNYFLHNGGGADSYRQYEQKIEQGRVVLCLVDSDQISPFAPKSETCKKVLEVCDSRTHIGEAMVTVGREIENHIPMSILGSLHGCKDVAGKDDILRLLQNQRFDSSRECVWLFFDTKKGVNGDNLSAALGDPRSRLWILEKYGDDFEAISYSGFGESIIKSFLGDEAAKAEFSRFMNSNYWRENFTAFFERFFWFLIADQRKWVN